MCVCVCVCARARARMSGVCVRARGLRTLSQIAPLHPSCLRPIPPIPPSRPTFCRPAFSARPYHGLSALPYYGLSALLYYGCHASSAVCAQTPPPSRRRRAEHGAGPARPGSQPGGAAAAPITRRAAARRERGRWRAAGADSSLIGAGPVGGLRDSAASMLISAASFVALRAFPDSLKSGELRAMDQTWSAPAGSCCLSVALDLLGDGMEVRRPMRVFRTFVAGAPVRVRAKAMNSSDRAGADRRRSPPLKTMSLLGSANGLDSILVPAPMLLYPLISEV